MDSNPTGTIALFIGGGLLLLLWVAIIVVARVQVRSLGERLDHNWSDVEETLSRRHRRAKKLAREADKLGALSPGDMSALNEAIALAEQENQPLLRANYEDDITLILRRIVESVRAVNRNKEPKYRLAYKRGQSPARLQRYGAHLQLPVPRTAHGSSSQRRARLQPVLPS